MSAPVGWFEIGSNDPQGVQEFYGGLFGWSFSPDELPGYTIIKTGEGHAIGGGISDARDRSSAYAIFCVQVEDVAATCARAEELGAKVIVAPASTDDGLVFAHLRDREGSHFGVFSPPPGG